MPVIPVKDGMPSASRGKHFRLRAIAIIASCLTSCTGTPTAPTETYSPPVIAPDLQAFANGWQTYVGEINQVARQSDCRPRLFRALPAVQRKGAVVMFHGFGGCPQQFFELAQRVSERGFDVVLPLLPGHGVLSSQTEQDELSFLPGTKTSEFGYAELARRINEIMALSPGTRVIVGFSLGGAISLNANLRAAELYDRQLLLSPMLAIRGGAVVEGLTEFFGRMPGIRNIIVKPSAFRKECKSWRTAGRAGFCDYRLRHVVPLIDLEEQNRDLNRQVTLTTLIQIVGAGDERYISNDQLVSFTEQQRQNGPISLCFMPDDVPHEMLSTYENVGRDMYWLAELLDDAVTFIGDGQFFPSEKNPEQNSGAVPSCRVSSPPTARIKGRGSDQDLRWPA
jgi:pimeloyl-ACP methyl ester carboxylesterase